jgi:hypothetical protein
MERMYRSTRTLVADNVILLVLAVTAFLALLNFLLLCRPEATLSTGVFVWWTALCAVSVFNICGWRLSAVALARSQTVVDPAAYVFQRRQLVLSAVYVLGCAFRSILPRADVQRIGLFDSWASSVMVGRSVATVAELCFVIQWALLLHKSARDAGCNYCVMLSWVVVPLIVVAEVCSWYAVLTTCYIGNAIEESLWALVAGLLIVGFFTLWPRCVASHRPFLAAVLLMGIAYVAFMSMVDVPMYVSRWLADEANGQQYLSLSQGLRDAGSRWTVTFGWEEWRTEIPWMSLYFSVGVWCSIALAHAPRFESKPRLGPADSNVE